MSYGQGCRTASTEITGLLEPLNESECKNVSGQLTPYFVWTKAKWIPGRNVNVLWKKKEAISPNVIRPTLNFSKLEDYVSLPSELQNVASLQNQVHFDDNIIALISYEI